MKVVVPVLALLAAACQAGAQAAPAPACQQPSKALVDRIAEMAPEGSGFTVKEAAAHRARNHGITTFVALRFVVRGKPLTGVWAVGPKLDGTGTVVAVDKVAKQWSQALAGDKVAADLKETEGAEALACLSS